MLKFMENLAKKAGDMALEERKHFSREEIHFKNPKDLVTDVDRKVEQFIRAEIEAAYPDHAILGEEGGTTNEGKSEYLWIIDPIDGTTSFVHGSPMYSVSIGLHRNGKPYAGAIYQPRLNELYSAILGGGAKCNGEPIHVSRHSELVNCLGITGFACLRAGLKKNNLPHFCRIAPLIRDIRRYGSAAYDLCAVASGSADFFWEMELQPYDIAAGEIILTEAGGRISDFSGGTGFPKQGILASNGIIHDDILRLLAMD